MPRFAALWCNGLFSWHLLASSLVWPPLPLFMTESSGCKCSGCFSLFSAAHQLAQLAPLARGSCLLSSPLPCSARTTSSWENQSKCWLSETRDHPRCQAHAFSKQQRVRGKLWHPPHLRISWNDDNEGGLQAGATKSLRVGSQAQSFPEHPLQGHIWC